MVLGKPGPKSEKKDLGERNLKRGANLGPADPRTEATLPGVEQGLEVEAPGCGRRTFGPSERLEANGKGATSLDEGEWLHAEKIP